MSQLRTATGHRPPSTPIPTPEREADEVARKALEGSVREEMEQRMGDSFSDVQLHTGPEAAKAASALEARAFTTGNHVVFNRGEYDPERAEGKYLLAHELAHVRQQTGGAISMLPQEGSSLVIDPDPELEREADEVAREALEGEAADPVVAHRLGMDVHVQRLPVAGALESIKQFKSMMDFNREAREAR
uniref:eCIS core domain-containing protein n=1 Tax=Natronobiforma cellulositropha TaxID=1679076 RepID=UPI0021D57076